MVIGERPIDETEHFSWKKKKFQHLGSWVVRVASNTDVPDAPSGFRAYSRETAMRMNVVNEYTYTLETIIQAGQSKMAVASVPIRTNPETRPSRLFSSMWRYMKRSASVIIRSTAMYRPLHFFGVLGTILFLLGVAVGVRFLVYFCMGGGHGHVQSLILASSLMMIGFQTITIGLLGDTVAANRKCSITCGKWTMTIIRKPKRRTTSHCRSRQNRNKETLHKKLSGEFCGVLSTETQTAVGDIAGGCFASAEKHLKTGSFCGIIEYNQ